MENDASKSENLGDFLLLIRRGKKKPICLGMTSNDRFSNGIAMPFYIIFG